MGAPELPNDPGDDGLQPHVHHIQHAPIPSDDSDNESTDAYEGYQPLAVMDNVENSLQMDYVEDDNDISVTIENDTDAAVSSEDINLPITESADDEIARRVWNEPRPQELQIELDSFRTEQILSAMANVSLPNTSVPDWARGVPEERWKDELLQRIRQRNNV